MKMGIDEMGGGMCGTNRRKEIGGEEIDGNGNR